MDCPFVIFTYWFFSCPNWQLPAYNISPLYGVTFHTHIFPMTGSFPVKKVIGSATLDVYLFPAMDAWSTTTSMACNCERLAPGSSSLVPLSSQPQSILSQSARLIRKSASDGQVSQLIILVNFNQVSCFFYAIPSPSSPSFSPPDSSKSVSDGQVSHLIRVS